MILKNGDFVMATYEGRTVKAWVKFASPNGKSLVIVWDDHMLGGHCGMMPILGHDDGSYGSLIEGKPITLSKIEQGGHIFEPDDGLADAYAMQNWPGYHNTFSRGEAPGAMRNGTRVVKVWAENGDRQNVGARGTVLGSIRAPLAAGLPDDVQIAYFVEWDALPHFAVFMVGKKIAEDK